MVQIFTNGIYTYRYDFEALCFDQIATAESIVSFRNHSMRKPALTMRGHELAGHTKINREIMALILRRVESDGSLAPWQGEASRAEARAFVDSLSGPDYGRAMECKADFFSRARIADYDSIMQLTPLVAELAGESLAGLQSTSDGLNSGERSSVESIETSDSPALAPGQRSSEG